MVKMYAHPPITEAVVEFRLRTNLDKKVIERIQQAFADTYPRQEHTHEIFIHLGPTPPKDEPLPSLKRMTEDATEMVLIKGNALGVIQLAPYMGWEHFIERVRRDWTVWRKRTDFKDLARLGVRFVNRIDVPAKKNEPISPSDYLRVLPSLPAAFEEISAFNLNVITSVGKIGAVLNLNTATVDSPLLEHVSFALDVDFGISENLPKKEDEIFELLENVRLEKNKLFEATVTDKAKALFNEPGY